MAYIDHATNTLNGGPEPTGYDDGLESMGQLCLKRLTEQGDFVVLVSREWYTSAKHSQSHPKT